MKISEGLKLLRVALNGHCSDAFETCPSHIMYDDIRSFGNRKIWTCDMCVEMFKPLGIDLKARLKERQARHHTQYKDDEGFDEYEHYSIDMPCPCLLAPEVALARLDEAILEYEERGE